LHQGDIPGLPSFGNIFQQLGEPEIHVLVGFVTCHQAFVVPRICQCRNELNNVVWRVNKRWRMALRLSALAPAKNGVDLHRQAERRRSYRQTLNNVQNA
jgi:hypothetical protein